MDLWGPESSALSDYVAQHATTRPTHAALIDPNVEMNWVDVDAEVDRIVAILRTAGLGPGDRIALMCQNSVPMVVLMFAAQRLGAVFVPLNLRWHDDDLLYAIAHSGARAVVAGDGFAQAARSVCATLDPRPMVLGVTTRAGDIRLSVHDAGTIPPEKSGVVKRGFESPSDITFSSGTSSRAKGVIHHHGWHETTGRGTARHLGLSAADISLAISPLFHVSGQWVWSTATVLGGTLVLLPTWDQKEFFTAIERHGVSFLHLITAVITDIVGKYPAEAMAAHTSSVRFTLAGGGVSTGALLSTYEQLVGGVVLSGYGRTEGGLCVDRPAVRDHERNGVVLDDVAQFRIRPQNVESDAVAGARGEIQVRGPGITRGYWMDAAATAAAFTDDGWMHTGDEGWFDDEGYLHFAGRLDGMIKTGGENVHPDEVASILLKHPAVQDVAVVGLPDPRLGQKVSALIVAPGETSETLTVWVSARIAGFRRPRLLVVVDDLPRLGNLKTDYQAVREQLATFSKGEAQ